MRRIVTTLTLFLAVGCECSKAPEQQAAPAPVAEAEPAPEPLPDDVVELDPYIETGDFDAIARRGVLRALVQEAEEALLPRDLRSTTVQREQVRAFARRNGWKVQFVAVDRFDALFPALIEGRGDVIADDLTVTKGRRETIAFTRPFATASELLIGRKGGMNPAGIEELEGREVHVLATSAYAETLEQLKEEKVPGLKIVTVQEQLDPESLVYEVSRGQRPLTVIDSHLNKDISRYNPDAEALFPLAEGREIAWAVRKDNPKLRAALDAFFVERALTEHVADLSTADLEGIRKRGAIRFLTRNNAVTYFLHRGHRMGFDFDLAQLAAKELGLRLEMIVVPSHDQLVPWLLEGRGDVIASSLTVTPERAEKVAFSRPYMFVDELLVQRTTGPKAASPADLKGKEVHVRPSSSYRRTLEPLAKEHGFTLVDAPEDLETEQLIARVAREEIDFTVADSHILQVESMHHDNVEAAFELGEKKEGADGSREIAFAVRPDNPQLRAFLDAFVKKRYRGLEYNMARRRYFQNTRTATKAKEASDRPGVISPYDEIIRRYAAQYALDWRLLSAQAFQESGFNPKAKSWVGARGLFQVMPATGREMGFVDLEDPEKGTHAGVKYLARLVGQLDPKLEFKQRLRFALAGYNAGLGHVQDARRLAGELGLNPDKWFGHVEKAMLLLQDPKYYQRARHGYCRGAEPVKYVSEIQNRYDHFVQLVPEQPAAVGDLR